MTRVFFLKEEDAHAGRPGVEGRGEGYKQHTKEGNVAELQKQWKTKTERGGGSKNSSNTPDRCIPIQCVARQE